MTMVTTSSQPAACTLHPAPCSHPAAGQPARAPPLPPREAQGAGYREAQGAGYREATFEPGLSLTFDYDVSTGKVSRWNVGPLSGPLSGPGPLA